MKSQESSALLVGSATAEPKTSPSTYTEQLIRSGLSLKDISLFVNVLDENLDIEFNILILEGKTRYASPYSVDVDMMFNLLNPGYPVIAVHKRHLTINHESPIDANDILRAINEARKFA
jgi:hypothetical protein